MSTCAGDKRHKRTNTLKEHTWGGECTETQLISVLSETQLISVPSLLRGSQRIIAYPRTKPPSQRHKHRPPLPWGAGVAGEQSTAQINPHPEAARGEAAAADKHSLPRMLYVASLAQVVYLPGVTDNLYFEGKQVKVD